MWPLQDPGPSSPLLSQASSSFLQVFTSPHLTASFLLSLPSAPHPGVLGEGPTPHNIEDTDLDREIPDLVWSGIGQRERGCGNPEEKQGFLLGHPGRLPGGGVAGTVSGSMSRHFFKAEGKVVQWASIASQAPCQACPQTHPSPGPEQ